MSGTPFRHCELDSPLPFGHWVTPMKSFIFNVSIVTQIGTPPQPHTRNAQVVAETLDDALSKFRAETPDSALAEVTAIQRAGVVTI